MRSTLATVSRQLAATLGFVTVALVAPQPVGAHSGLDFSLPTDGASVGEPISEITVAFTLPVTLVGNGFEVLDPQENVLLPFAVTDDNAIFRLQFESPLAGGLVDVAYKVTSEDGHILSGAFTFTVSVDAPSTTTVPPTLPEVTEPPTAAPATSPPPTTVSQLAEATSVPVTALPADGAAQDQVITAPGSLVGGSSDGSGEPSNSGLVIAISAAVAVLAAGFVLLRSRSSSAA